MLCCTQVFPISRLSKDNLLTSTCYGVGIAVFQFMRVNFWGSSGSYMVVHIFLYLLIISISRATVDASNYCDLIASAGKSKDLPVDVSTNTYFSWDFQDSSEWNYIGSWPVPRWLSPWWASPSAPGCSHCVKLSHRALPLPNLGPASLVLFQ